MIPRRRNSALLVFALFALMKAAAWAGAPGEFPLLLGDWTRPEILDDLSHLKAEVKANEEGLMVTAPAGQSGSFFFEVPAAAENWKPFAALAVVVKNCGSQPVKLTLQAEKIVGARNVSPGETLRLAMPLNNPAFRFSGMRVQPPFEGWGKYQDVHGNADLQEIKVVAFQLQSKAPASLQIQQLKLLPPIKSDGMVDEFGQLSTKSWPGKILSEDDLKQPDLASAEITSVAAFDNYGGLKDGPKTTASGFFRTEKINGQWRLVTPEGHVFFSAGVNSVTSADPTVVSGRESLFAKLPKGGPLMAHFAEKEGTKTFDFYEANLQRKYGTDWQEKWNEETVSRLKAWGFNTIGAWSSPQVIARNELPYTAIVHLSGDFATIHVDGSGKHTVPDPFDPRYAAALESRIKNDPANVMKDPMCIGYFVGNEFTWGGWDGPSRYAVVLGVLKKDETSPAKVALCKRLQEKYADVKKLADRWKMRISSWNALQQSAWKLPGKWSPELEQDLQMLSQYFADEYFKTVRDAIRRADPNHLYLGCRFANKTPEFVIAAAKFCDVTSFNLYRPAVSPGEPALSLFAKQDRPALLSEFHNGATDRGMFATGMVWSANQEMRANGYRDYLFSAAELGFIVGCHWFQLVDQPLTGRPGDGENYGIGLVTVGDKPYTELTNMAATVNRDVYAHRLNPQPKPKNESGNDQGRLASTQ